MPKTTTGPESSTDERRLTEELLEAVKVRIGLVAVRDLHLLLRAYFANKDRSIDYFAPGGVAERNVAMGRIVGAAAGSLIGIDRDLVTTAALLMQTDGRTTINAIGAAAQDAKTPDEVRLVVQRCALQGLGVKATATTREGVILHKTFEMVEQIYALPVSLPL